MKKYFKTIGKALFYVIVYILVQFFVGVAVGATILNAVFTGAKSMVLDLIAMNIFIILVGSAGISLLIYMAILKYKGKNIWRVCNFKRIPAKHYLINAILAIAFTFVTSGIVSSMGKYFQSYTEVSNTMLSGISTIFGLLTMIILMPIFEEILFRGLVFSELKDNMNIIAALIIQGFLFGLIHGNILQGSYTLILGIIAALACLWSKSIMSAITIHIFFNLSGLIIVPVVLAITPQYKVLYMVLGVVIAITCLMLLYKMRVSNESDILMLEEKSEFEDM